MMKILALPAAAGLAAILATGNPALAMDSGDRRSKPVVSYRIISGMVGTRPTMRVSACSSRLPGDELIKLANAYAIQQGTEKGYKGQPAVQDEYTHREDEVKCGVSTLMWP